MKGKTKKLIKAKISESLDAVITRRCITEPFLEEEVKERNPFGARLVPMEVWKGSKFERSFVTILGQGIFEQIAKIIAEGTGAFAENQHVTPLTVCTFRLDKIDEIINNQRQKRGGSITQRLPDWDSEVKNILDLENDRYQEIKVTSDLYINRPNGEQEFYSFKTVKPNLDQTENAKRDMLRLVAGNTDYKVFFALPYNPAGEGRLYKGAGHTIPYKLFNMDADKSVIMGASLWNRIGDDQNTYQELLEVFDKVGRGYIKIIKKDYLKI
ncbi:MAG: TdeIII family type II restriction endonuclease [Syntrophomonadaceae bacterium]|nr:TdeIII family type II restriction endonuclease [Syntrophomonadaceae bacterium]